ncbi:hypothetical protein JCM10914A_23610 [Paenibacillus sp. JCM 10914]|uniref:response regulator transcription factor n=1 Tax=Paenibacillus sp. JCM 10914 TaxID=1236974 RepID=UPI000568C881|nr:response regulator [Paenibacillus sp. JCM 10914]
MKVMIVDDEVIIRNGLSTVINWTDNGFTMLAPAASGEEALQRIPLELPEIVFTDIRMTGISGLEMARRVKEQFAEIEIIVISGFDEFAYAQQAMREGVSDYLLKTSRPGEIIEAAVQARERLLQRRQNQAKGKAQEMVVNRGFLRRLLVSGSPLDGQAEAELWERFPELSLNEQHSCLQIWILFIYTQNPTDSEQTVSTERHSTMGAELAEELQGAWLEWNGSLLLLIRTHQDSGWGRIDSVLRRLEEQYECRIFAAGGHPVRNARELNLALNTAVEASSYEWLLGQELRIRYEDIEGRKGIRTVCSMEEEAELSSLLRAGHTDHLKSWIQELLGRIRLQDQATPGSVQAYLHSLLVSAQRWLERAAISIGYSVPVNVEETYDIRQLTKTPAKVLYDSLELIMKQYSDMVSTTSPAQRAITYIHEHLGQSLSLQQVAKHVHMNPNYFSEMFKKETGQNYIEFVTHAKLRKSMTLLKETPAKISEIANEIGYEDIKYFNRLFKKFTGLTPSEYRANPEFCPSTD